MPGIGESEMNKAWLLSSRGLVVQGQAIGRSTEKAKSTMRETASEEPKVGRSLSYLEGVRVSQKGTR